MKAVLMSIHPKWCELIFSGEKIIEVRKTAPKLEMPYKVYVYETKGATETPWVDEDGHFIYKGCGQVVGEFVCDTLITDKTCGKDALFNGAACLTQEECEKYSGGKVIYGLYITEAKRYYMPKELYEFTKVCNTKSDCGNCNRRKWMLEDGIAQFMGCDKHIYRAPQSWCYVEEVVE